MLTEVRGCLFRSKVQALVNTVNCVGPMGRGIALEFQEALPRYVPDLSQRPASAGCSVPGMIFALHQGGSAHPQLRR